MTQRIEPSFYKWLEDLNFLLQRCLIESNFFFEKKKKMTRRIEFFFFEKHDSRNWTIFPCDSRNWTLLSNMTHSNWTLLLFLTWLKELNLIWNMTQRIEKSWFFIERIESFLNMTWKIELFLNVAHRIELFYDSRTEFFFRMTKILLNTTQSFELFFFFLNMSQRIEPFFENMFNELFFSMILWIELIFSALPIEWNTWENDSKNWTFIAIKHDTKNWTSCEIKFVLHDPKNWTFPNMTQRIEPFWPDSNNWVFFSEGDSQNWAFFFFLNVTHRIVFFFESDSKNWTLFHYVSKN